MTSLDPGSGCAIIAAATARKVRTIDYDRLNTGCKGANYYVSFNNPTVGKLMGQGVKAAMTAKGLLGAGKKPVIAYLNGGPTDNNSKLFKQGYAGVLDPLIKSGKATKGPDRACPVGQPEGAHDLRADARQTVQQDRRGRRGERRARERGRDRAQGEEAQADPAVRAGRDGAGRAEHHLGLAVRDGVQARQDRGAGGGHARHRADQGRLSRRSTARRTTACATCRRSSRPRSGSRRRTSTCSTRTDSSRSPRSASARTSSTARQRGNSGGGAAHGGFPTLLEQESSE